MEHNLLEHEDLLFHFTKTKTALEFIIKDCSLKFSRLINTNDPKEYSRIFHRYVNYDIHDIFELWGDEVSSDLNSIIKKQYGIICFCSNMKPHLFDEKNLEIDFDIYQPSWKRSRMWSQYGDNHSGICFILSKKKMEIELNRDVHIFKPIEYRIFSKNDGNLHDLEKIDVKELNKGKVTYIANYIKTHSDILFFTKNIDYRDEAEYRLITSDISQDFLKIENCLEGVIIGHKTPKVYHQIIKDFCLDLSIDCYKIGWKNGAPIFANWSN